MEKIAGINERRLNFLVLEIRECAEKINKISNQLRDITYDTKTCFKSELGDEFRKKCNLSLDEFNTINKNILNYAQALVNTKSKYDNIGDKVDEILRSSDV